MISRPVGRGRTPRTPGAPLRPEALGNVSAFGDAPEAKRPHTADDGSLLEQGARALGLALGEDALEARLEEYSSLECAEFMWHAKTGEFDDVRQAIQ